MRQDGTDNHSDSLMMNCQARQEELKAYLDGELPRIQRVAMWWHLLRCGECREARKAMTEISRRLAAGETEALDPALRARILASVTYTESPREKPLTARPRRLWNPLLLGGATAAGLVVILLMGPFQGREPAKMGIPAPSTPSFAPAATDTPTSGSGKVEMNARHSPATTMPPQQSRSDKSQRAPVKPLSAQDRDEASHVLLDAAPLPASQAPAQSQSPANAMQYQIQTSRQDPSNKVYLNGAPHGVFAPAGSRLQSQVPASSLSPGNTVETSGSTAKTVETMKSKRDLPVVTDKAPAKSRARAQSRPAKARSTRMRVKSR